MEFGDEPDGAVHDVGGVLANPSNPMVGVGKAEGNIETISSASRENLRRLLREPFVARVERLALTREATEKDRSISPVPASNFT
jgi:hypothetical protein